VTEKHPPAHFVQGTIRYSPDHVALLGWSEEERKTVRDKSWSSSHPGGDEGVDVYQYRRQNRRVPSAVHYDQFFVRLSSKATVPW